MRVTHSPNTPKYTDGTTIAAATTVKMAAPIKIFAGNDNPFDAAVADGVEARSTLRLGLACGPDGLTFVLVWTFDTLPLALRTWVGACHRREEANRSKREREDD